jgi:hypothetical protein
MVALLMAAAVRLDQWLLRRSAEHLLSDLRSLELRESTYGDARKIMVRWHNDLRQGGPCQQVRCDFQVVIGDTFWRYSDYFAYHPRLALLYRSLGGRAAAVWGFVHVREGLVVGKGIEAGVESHSVSSEDGSSFDFVLMGRARSDWPMVIRSLHPEYSLGGPDGCTNCVTIWATFTPFADVLDVRRLMDIDFSCFTRWKPCTTKAEIMPAAWNQLLAEKDAEAWPAKSTCSPSTIRTLSREASTVAVGEVTEVSPCEPSPEITLRLTDNLKQRRAFYLPWQILPGQLEKYRLPSNIHAQKGDRYVVFFDGSNPYLTDSDGCEFVAANEKNIAAVQRGIGEDVENDLYDDFYMLGGYKAIKPPAIEVR